MAPKSYNVVLKQLAERELANSAREEEVRRYLEEDQRLMQAREEAIAAIVERTGCGVLPGSGVLCCKACGAAVDLSIDSPRGVPVDWNGRCWNCDPDYWSQNRGRLRERMAAPFKAHLASGA